MLPPLRNKAASAYFSRRPAAIESGNFKTPVAQYNDFLKEKCRCSLETSSYPFMYFDTI